MKLPSIQILLASLIYVCKRFPFVIFAALVSTFTGIYILEVSPHGTELYTTSKIMMSASLGLPLFFALHIFFERMQSTPMFKFAGLVTSVFLLVQFYFSLSGLNTDHAPLFYRFFFWSAGLHLLVSFSVFFIKEELNGFWQFNKQLFLRFLTAALYSGVLYLGLAGAILSISALFNVDFHGEIYGNLWLLISGLFNTIFFLGGIDRPVEGLNHETSYPKGLKVFTQYVLLPLVTIYLMILYAYMAKILVQMNLPKGWVANLILGFSVTGILSLLLVYPLRNHEDNRWIKTFSRFFYISLVPLVALLFIAIGTRITEYGVTIERYIVAMLGVWLALVTLYFIFSKTKNIILIPLTLSLFLFGSCFGPWGMFAVSERSQIKRLHNLLDKNGMLMGGKIEALPEAKAEKVKVKDINQINSILEYLGENHGFEGIKEWLDEDCHKQVFNDSLEEPRYEQVYKLQKCLGLYGATGYRNGENENEINLNFYCNQFGDINGLEITGYDRIYNFNAYEYKGEGAYIDYSANSFAKLEKNTMLFYLKGQRQFALSLDSFATKLKMLPQGKFNSYSVEPSDMILEVANLNGSKVKLLFNGLNSRVTDTSTTVNSISGYLLVKKQGSE